MGWLLPARYQQAHRPGLISCVCCAQHLEGRYLSIGTKSVSTRLLSSQFYYMQQKPGLFLPLTELLKPCTWSVRDSCCRSVGNSSSEMTRSQRLPACRRSRKSSAAVVAPSSVTSRDYNKMSRHTRPSTATSTCLSADPPTTSGNAARADPESDGLARSGKTMPPADLWRCATSCSHRGATLRPSLATW